jgi:hypothetical protein
VGVLFETDDTAPFEKISAIAPRVAEHAVTLHLAVQGHFDEFTRLSVVFCNIWVEAAPLRRICRT